jgi:hypothetical protein
LLRLVVIDKMDALCGSRYENRHARARLPELLRVIPRLRPRIVTSLASVLWLVNGSDRSIAANSRYMLFLKRCRL